MNDDGYSTQMASDIVRDGLGIELLDESHNVIAEVFRCNRDKTVSVSLCWRAD